MAFTLILLLLGLVPFVALGLWLWFTRPLEAEEVHLGAEVPHPCEVRK